MKTSVVQLGFDYEQLDPEVRTDVRESARRIHELERRTSESIIEIGNELVRVKSRLRGTGRNFGDWIELEFGWSWDTANNFMKVSQRFADFPKISEFQPSALYALASNNVPDEIRDGFMDVAEAGRKVTHSDVKEAIQEHKAAEALHNEIETGFVCEDCGEIFSVDVWPCPACDHHWGQGDDTCKNCYRPREGFLEDDDEDFAPEEDRPVSPQPQPAPAPPPSEPKQPHVSHNSGENEWYTPSQYIEAAREVLGTIDLDPASSDVANERVKATSYFTKDDNGLAHEWHGSVWLNPPYAQPLISNFAEKVVEEFEDGRVKAAIVLVNNATETRWFRQMTEAATAICFPTGRIKYLDSTGHPANTPLQGQAFLYFGDDTYEFLSTFRQFGFVVEVA